MSKWKFTRHAADRSPVATDPEDGSYVAWTCGHIEVSPGSDSFVWVPLPVMRKFLEKMEAWKTNRSRRKAKGGE